MEIKFCGANKCVTGSCHLLKINNKQILLDCGKFQGEDEKIGNNEDFIFNPKEISLVILSHTHIDHSGRIMLLYQRGFTGKVICTKATVDLCKIILEQNEELSKKEIESYLDKFEGYDYNQVIKIDDKIQLVFKDAGHMLGSAICELNIKENNKNIKLIYSGDLGNLDLPLVKDPEKIYRGDYLILESTYGDRVHKIKRNEFAKLIDIIKDITEKQGNVLIPAFSLGRTQEILYTLNKFIEKEKLKVKVYVDSPLASKITDVFENNFEYFDKQAKKYIEQNDNPLDFKNLYFTSCIDESKELKNLKGVVIIAASGDCNKGRIIHHIKNNIEDENSALVFVCSQGNKTLGREILEGKKEVTILGETLEVKSKIYNLQSLSGHGDCETIKGWIDNFLEKPKKIYLVHGEEIVLSKFKENLEKAGYFVKIPNYGESEIIDS
ncbi:MBL fold metallo-hydrolase RNA specificity domain-containing protein [Clostridium ihumii]|uniref:MBL fold metallo-hydrolase RNA specificity domain-containing protein n=1 Tax=Clostridium ihumii TaxID=1470356 RepID=UPI000684644A|nr:MBL fold metallo-hydrolase [Clostridium ihumii]